MPIDLAHLRRVLKLARQQGKPTITVDLATAEALIEANTLFDLAREDAKHEARQRSNMHRELNDIHVTIRSIGRAMIKAGLRSESWSTIQEDGDTALRLAEDLAERHRALLEAMRFLHLRPYWHTELESWVYDVPPHGCRHLSEAIKELVPYSGA